MSEKSIRLGMNLEIKKTLLVYFLLHIWEFLRPNKLFFSLHRMARRREITEIDGNANYWKVKRSDR